MDRNIEEIEITSHFTQSISQGFQVKLAFRSDLHISRKVWHLSMGLFMAFIYYFSGIAKTTAIFLLASAFGLAVFVEMARLRVSSFNDKVLKFWGPLMRSCEVNKVSGTPYYILATLLSILIFPKPVAALAVLYLACGDPMASLFGILYGKKSIRFSNGKSLIGTMAGVITCIITGLVFLSTLPLSLPSLIAISFVGGVAGGTAELLPFDVDDNFTIPVISGFVLWLAFMIFSV